MTSPLARAARVSGSPDPAVVHRPTGSGHPYATSPDQRVPVRPESGEPVRLGVVVADGVSAVTCEWVDETAGTTTTLSLTTAQVSAADAAALAGGDGHLAEAQAAVAGADGGWAATSPVLEAGRRYRYRFLAATGAAGSPDASDETPSAVEGTSSEPWSTEWFDVSAGEWVADGGELVPGGTANRDGGVAGASTPESAVGPGLAERLVPGSVAWLRDT